jgi:hypothetical protein
MTIQWSLSQGVRSCSRSHVRPAKAWPGDLSRNIGVPSHGMLHEAHARPRRDARSVEDAGPRDARACAAFTQSPCFSSVSCAASSAFTGQPRPRETSAISASATTHLAPATASLGPKARRTLQERHRAHDTAKREGRRVISQANPFRYAEEVTRGEIRAGAVIGKSIGIPSHLSLPRFRWPALSVSRDRQAPTVSSSEW